MAIRKTPFNGPEIFWPMAAAAIHMMSMTIVIPGLYTYLISLGGDVTQLGWAFAAYPIGAALSYRYLKDSPLGPIQDIKKFPTSDDKKSATLRSRCKPTTRLTYCFLIIVAIGGNCLYALAPNPVAVVGARILVGIGGGAMVLSHKTVEFSTDADDVMVRSRMVMLGACQSFGSIAGIALGLALCAVPSFTLLNHSISQPKLCALAMAGLYFLLLPGIWMNFKPIDKLVYDKVDERKGEMDVPPSNYMGFARFGVLVPAIVYDRGQARPTSLPDVFSTAVVLVLSFFLNNMMTGIEVIHGVFCHDEFSWGVMDTTVTYFALILAGAVGVSLTLSLSDEVPCNRRLFGGLVLTFVTYGVMMQPATPKEQYIGFLVLTGCCYFICDLALTEIYIDKIGEEDDCRLTSTYKGLLMNWLNSTQSFARIIGSIVAGYIYSYYSAQSRIPHRSFALYGCGFAVALLLIVMTIIFYKRFILRSQEQQIMQPDKIPLQPQQISCMDESTP